VDKGVQNTINMCETYDKGRLSFVFLG